MIGLQILGEVGEDAWTLLGFSSQNLEKTRNAVEVGEVVKLPLPWLIQNML